MSDLLDFMAVPNQLDYLHHLEVHVVLLLVIYFISMFFSYFFTYPSKPFCTSFISFSVLFFFFFFFNSFSAKNISYIYPSSPLSSSRFIIMCSCYKFTSSGRFSFVLFLHYLFGNVFGQLIYDHILHTENLCLKTIFFSSLAIFRVIKLKHGCIGTGPLNTLTFFPSYLINKIRFQSIRIYKSNNFIG